MGFGAPEKLEKKMEVTLLGTGCPVAHPKRMGPATLVRAGEQTLLVDCGSGVTQQLVKAGSRSAAIDALFVTHLHSDHLVDLYQLIVSSWHGGRQRPHRLFVPKGVRAFVEGTMAVWKEERAQRLAYEHRPSAAAFELEVVEMEEGVVFDQDGMRVEAFLVDHGPVRPAFGLTFERGGVRTVVSGDTTRCDALDAAAAGADLLVHEVFVHREMVARPGVRSTAGIEATAAYHTLSSEVGKVAAKAQPGMLMLTHIVPVDADRDALLAEVRKDFSGPTVVGEDLVSVDVESGTLSYADLRCSIR
jgi:ribonuclease Z